MVDPTGTTAVGHRNARDPDRCPSDDEVIQLVEGRLDSAGRAAIHRHLDRCEVCADVLAAFGEVAAPPADGADEALYAGRFRIGRLLGAGATSVVHAAHDTQLDREVALKRIRADARAQGIHQGLALRMLREARNLARLSHPNVVALHDFGRRGDEVYLVCELVDGQSLEHWLAEESRTAAQIVEAYRQAARGLAAAHELGLIHRDVKPANLLIGGDGRVRVADFGLAVATDSQDTRLTATGAIVGTPAYMAPEQLQGGRVDARSDQYALCVCLAEALTGFRPFPSTARARLERGLRAHDHEVAPLRGVLAALERGLRSDPAERFASVSAFERALGRPSRRRRRAALLAGAGATAVLGALAWAIGWQPVASGVGGDAPMAMLPADAGAGATTVPVDAREPVPDASGVAAPPAKERAPARPPPEVPSSRERSAGLTPEAARQMALWQQLSRRVTTFDGVGCLSTLEELRQYVPDVVDSPQVRVTAGQCQMYARRCLEGTATIRAALSELGLSGGRLEDSVSGHAEGSCWPDDDPPSPAAAWTRAARLAGQRELGTCRELLGILPRLPAPEHPELAHGIWRSCAETVAEAGDCALARRAFEAAGDGAAHVRERYPACADG